MYLVIINIEYYFFEILFSWEKESIKWFLVLFIYLNVYILIYKLRVIIVNKVLDML